MCVCVWERERERERESQLPHTQFLSVSLVSGVELLYNGHSD